MKNNSVISVTTEKRLKNAELAQPVHKTEGVNHTKTMWFHPSPFTGKERDEETGYGYFGARYMDYSLMTMWLSVDPLADKYPNISPYVYCAWNPVKLVDPDGREVYINGNQADQSVERLQTKKMNITRDVQTGKLSVAFRGKYSLNDLDNEETLLYNAIVSKDVIVHVTAAKSKQIVQKGEIIHTFVSAVNGEIRGTYGGSFSGALYHDDNGIKSAQTYQYLDVDLLDENGYNQGVPHEVTESFLLGQRAITLERSIEGADELPDQSNDEYKKCHERAIPQNSLGLMFRFGGRYIHFPRSKFGRTK